MAGQIRQMIDRIVSLRAKGDPIVEMTTTTKLLLKGVQVDKYDRLSADDATVIAKLKEIAKEIGVSV